MAKDGRAIGPQRAHNFHPTVRSEMNGEHARRGPNGGGGRPYFAYASSAATVHGGAQVPPARNTVESDFCPPPNAATAPCIVLIYPATVFSFACAVYQKLANPIMGAFALGVSLFFPLATPYVFLALLPGFLVA